MKELNEEMAQIVATMAGTVLNVLVSAGNDIQMDQDVIVLESMKMEVPVQANQAGKVTTVHVQPGDFVNEGDPLLDIEN
jgi:acetyl-CoA carboxylase biotin carboxyl carrier protein